MGPTLTCTLLSHTFPHLAYSMHLHAPTLTGTPSPPTQAHILTPSRSLWSCPCPCLHTCAWSHVSCTHTQAHIPCSHTVAHTGVRTFAPSQVTWSHDLLLSRSECLALAHLSLMVPHSKGRLVSLLFFFKFFKFKYSCFYSISGIQQSFCSVAQSCSTLCDPMDHSMPGFPVLYHLLEFAQTHVH